MASTQETYRLAFPTHPNPPYTHVSYGIPFHKSCSEHVAETYNAKRAYIIASTSLSKQTSHVTELEKALGSRHGGTWIGIRPHTPWEDLIPIINDMREKNADLLITLGGGSLTDGAKIIIYGLANNVRTLDDLDQVIALQKSDESQHGRYMRDRSSGNAPTVPMIFIPTTLSAGEYSCFGGGTSSKTHLKSIIHHPKMFASLVILDPTLTTTTPEWVWISTGVRAIDHCVESSCSVDPPEEVTQESHQALKLLLPNLLQCKQDPSDLEARMQCQLAANKVLVSLLYMPERLLAGGSHGIGHQLGPLGVGHGQTSCILLPSVLKYNKSVNASQQQKIQNIIWADPVVTELLKKAGLEQDTTDVGDALDVYFRALGMPRSLKEVGVNQDQFDLLAENSIKDPCCVVNPIPLVKKEQVLEILHSVA